MTLGGVSGMNSPTLSSDTLVTLDDVADSGIPAVTTDDSLARALRVITENDVDKCAVCDAEGYLKGYIRYHDIFAVYHQYLKKPEAGTES